MSRFALLTVVSSSGAGWSSLKQEAAKSFLHQGTVNTGPNLLEIWHAVILACCQVNTIKMQIVVLLSSSFFKKICTIIEILKHSVLKLIKALAAAQQYLITSGTILGSHASI